MISIAKLARGTRREWLTCTHQFTEIFWRQALLIFGNQKQDIVSNTRQNWELAQIIDHNKQRCSSLAADEHSTSAKAWITVVKTLAATYLLIALKRLS